MRTRPNVVAASVVALALAVCLACSAPRESGPAVGTTTERQAQAVTPGNAARTRTSLPPDYEVFALPPVATPLALWGIGVQPNGVPEGCTRALAAIDPVAGWAASGPGGIVHVAVAPAQGVAPPSPADCTPWTVSTDRTEGAVTFDVAPEIVAATTVGLVTSMTTEVEGGTETHSRAETFVAYLDSYMVFVVVVTDPGASGPSLPPGFAAKLLVDTVAAIRA